jgi:hypothetical protein
MSRKTAEPNALDGLQLTEEIILERFRTLSRLGGGPEPATRQPAPEGVISDLI